MTKPTIPEPTAEIRIVGNVTIFDLTPVGKQQCLSVGQKFITTDQAEAYATAKVREALELAIAICDAAYEQGESEYRTSCNPYFEGGCDAAESIETKIRALLLK